MSGVRFDAEAIRGLAQILRDTDLTEIEVVEGENRIRVARAAPAPMQVSYAAGPAAPMPMPVAAVPAPAAAGANDEHPGLVASPMVGVAYLAADPSSPPFVALGAKVAQGQTLLLIEAMKTFNQIRSPRDGTVTRILVDTGTPVEYGEPLMLVE